MKTNNIIYWVSTGILTLTMLFSAGMYFFKNAEVQQAFMALGYPTHIIYPLAIAKLLGLVAIWTNKIHWLKEWAYAGFFFDTALAVTAHLYAKDGAFIPALVALVMVILSFYTWKIIDRKSRLIYTEK